jgi:hypothetical protein
MSLQAGNPQEVRRTRRPALVGRVRPRFPLSRTRLDVWDRDPGRPHHFQHPRVRAHRSPADSFGIRDGPRRLDHRHRAGRRDFQRGDRVADKLSAGDGPGNGRERLRRGAIVPGHAYSLAGRARHGVLQRTIISADFGNRHSPQDHRLFSWVLQKDGGCGHRILHRVYRT